MQQFVLVEQLTLEQVPQALVTTITGPHLIAVADSMTTLDTSGFPQVFKAGPLSR
jgi:hypothetical protein